MQNALIYHGGSARRGNFTFSGGGGGGGNAPVLLQTNFQYNDSQHTTLDERFIAWKVICKHTFVADSMGCFIYDTNDDKKMEMGIYSEEGLRLARTGEKTLGSYLHEEIQYDLSTSITMTKNVQYWLGLWGKGIDIGTEVGFSNLGTVFPGRVHCIDEESETSLPSDIHTYTPGTQQLAIWAKGFTS